jgi:hypothetical protein
MQDALISASFNFNNVLFLEIECPQSIKHELVNTLKAFDLGDDLGFI